MGALSPIPEPEPLRQYPSPDPFDAPKVSIAVVDPDPGRSRQVEEVIFGPGTGAVQFVSSYVPNSQDAARLACRGFDMYLVGIDGSSGEAMRTVENLCALGRASVVVYSERPDSDLLIHAMRSGAREFLAFPISQDELDETISRVALRKQAAPIPKKTSGQVLVFAGAKGGAGVTTIACNYAVALAEDPSKQTLLVDFDLPLGDAALDLGLTGDFSTVDALRESERLDAAFLSRLLVRHSSGLSLLAAPGRFLDICLDHEAARKLLTVAQESFDYVVVDAGSRPDWTRACLFDLASRIYLVTQVGIPELRNAQRIVTSAAPAYGPKLEVVLNRYATRALGVDDAVVERALPVEPHWRIPNDYAAVREMQSRAVPLVLNDSPIARVIRRMAAEVSGLQIDEKKKGLFALFR